MGEHRSIGAVTNQSCRVERWQEFSHEDDDNAAIIGFPGRHFVLFFQEFLLQQQLADWDSSNLEIIRPAVIALTQHPDCVRVSRPLALDKP